MASNINSKVRSLRIEDKSVMMTYPPQDDLSTVRDSDSSFLRRVRRGQTATAGVMDRKSEPMFDGKVRHFMAPGPHSKTLDLLERSLIHAKAEELHDAHRTRIEELTKSQAGWANIGSTFDVEFHKIPRDLQQQLQVGQPIGSQGGSGVVRRIVYRDVPLAKKSILTYSKDHMQGIKEEVTIGKKLDGDQHIVKLVGTYITTSDGNLFLNILTFPVAACDLHRLLEDCEAMNEGYKDLTLAQACDISVRSMSLGYPDFDSLSKTHETLNRLLKRIMGCLARAVKFLHSQDVQHRDLKPQNVLLRPGHVYLTDFGISRSAENATTQSFAGYSAGYTAPEVLEQGDVNPAEADIYSLGCIYLHIITVLVGATTGARRKTLTAILLGEASKREAELDRYMEELLKLVGEDGGQRWRLTIPFLAPLLANERKRRPDAAAIDDSLMFAGGERQIYHGMCCQQRSLPENKGVKEVKKMASLSGKKPALLGKEFEATLSRR